MCKGIKWLHFNFSEHMTAASRSFDGPDLGTYCLQKLSADDKSSLVGKI